MNLLASAIYAKEVMIEWQGKISFRDPKNCTIFKLKMNGPPNSTVIHRFLGPYTFRPGRSFYFEGPSILPGILTAVFQRTVKRATRTIINGDGAFTLHACPDGFW